jgi:hypothetical protein
MYENTMRALLDFVVLLRKLAQVFRLLCQCLMEQYQVLFYSVGTNITSDVRYLSSHQTGQMILK